MKQQSEGSKLGQACGHSKIAIFCAKSLKNSRKQVENGSFSAVFLVEAWRYSLCEDICTCGLQASLTPLRAICELQASGTRTAIFAFFDYQTLHIVRIFRKIVLFCTLFPLFPYRTIPVVVSYVVKH